MFRSVVSAVALCLVSAVAPALAADIPVKPIYKAPVMAPVSNWYGFYIGAHGGYGWGNDGINYTPDAFYALPFATGVTPLTGARDPRGAIGGFQWGSNWQFDRTVLGLESDFSFSGIKASQTINGVLLGIPFTATAEQSVKWLSTTRLRVGYLVTPDVLVYGTGGLATGRVESRASNTLTIPGGCLIPGGCPSGSASDTRWGWAAGAGIEYSTGPWQFRVEYLHYDLGTLSYSIRDAVAPGAAIGASTRFADDVVRGGISYRFNWTPFDLIFGRRG
jgi:outer membrane immunogenic protein